MKSSIVAWTVFWLSNAYRMSCIVIVAQICISYCVNLLELISQNDVFQNLSRNAGQGYWIVIINTVRSP